ncbi:MAG: hypothetical protein U0Q14_07545 [Dermatophilaceae bacterium]|jgi:uncharacterized protein involved in exopolysaccharide biosynthesis|nr:hypothetical protein [Candidatus Lutibacillus vidarii]
MEIIDYLSLARRRLRILIGVPLVAALLVFAWTFLRPAEYKSTATVNTATLVGGESNSFNGPQGPNQFVAAYAAAVNMPKVAKAVSDATGVAAADIRSGIDVAPTGASPQMVVSYFSGDQKSAEPVVKGVALQALRELFEPRAQAAEQGREIALKEVNSVSTALADFVKTKRIADPPANYQAQLAKVNGLQQQQASFRANGNSTAAAALEKPIEDAQTVLVELSALTAEYNGLAARVKAANDDLASAQRTYRLAATEWAAAQAAEIVFVKPVTEVDRKATLLTLLPSAVGASLLLAVILVLLMELLGRGQSRKPSEAPSLGETGASSESVASGEPPADMSRRSR